VKTPSVVAALIPALAIALLLGACSSREERKVEYFNRAQAAFNAGDFAKASVDTKNALQIDETYVDARFLWAQLYEKQQNWQQMIGNLRIVLEYDKNHLEARLKYGTILMAAQLLEDAMAEADAAIAIKPDSAEALALKGAVFYKQGLNAQAIATAQWPC